MRAKCPWREGESGSSTSSDINSPDEVGPPEVYAWLHYEPVPTREDMARR